jgi:hypothetical protein
MYSLAARSAEWFAVRWKVSPETAQGFLENFERRGLAVRDGERWRPTDRAVRHFGWLTAFRDEDIDALAGEALDDVAIEGMGPA